MFERALVTGATGFVGSHIARRLVADGVEVHAIARPGARIDRVPDLEGTVAFHFDDGDAASVAAIVARVRPEVTFHLATHFVAEHEIGDVDALVEGNIAFPTRLADALAGVRECTHLVNAGTAWQHVDGAGYRPKNLYAATKQAYEDVLAHYSERAELRVVTLNLFDTYGPGDHRGKLLSALMGALATGEPLRMGSGSQLVDFVHVDDVATAFVDAAQLPGHEPAMFAVSSGEARRVRDVVALLSAVAGRAVPVEWGAREDRPGDMTTPWASGPPLPGWSPTIDLRTGLAALLADRARY